MKITEKEFNVITGEETVIEREETEAETLRREFFELEAARLLVLKNEAEAAKEAAEEKLAALGLTIDDLKALGLGGN